MWRKTNCWTGSEGASRNAAGTPAGSIAPHAATKSPASSLAARYLIPARRVSRTFRPAMASPMIMSVDAGLPSGATKRSLTSSAVSGPSMRNRSTSPSSPRACQPSLVRCSSASTSMIASASNNSARGTSPSSSRSTFGSTLRAASRRSPMGVSPWYMNSPTYPKSRERAKGDGTSVSTSTTEVTRCAMSAMVCVSAPVS